MSTHPTTHTEPGKGGGTTILWCRLDAPMMSFGGESIDSHSVTRRHPSTSMLTGLIANALGWRHQDAPRLQALQDALEFAARADVPGELVTDYQTVDLGQDFLLDSRAWTTWGKLDERAGGSSTGTHIRQRDYIADAVYTIALSLDSARAGVTLEAIAQALDAPARPLFLGRKCCLPAPMKAHLIQARSPRHALQELIPLSDRYSRLGKRPPARIELWWTTPEPSFSDAVTSRLISDRRDWKNQVHTGQRWMAQGILSSQAITPLSREQTP